VTLEKDRDMSNQQKQDTPPSVETFQDSGAATATIVKTRPAPTRVDRLPMWKVLLHNDDFNEIGYVVETIIELTCLRPQQALLQTLEADRSGVALLMSTHRERAELLSEQFASKRLTVTIEPDR
jgi:ATP-dependent Clp protease adapter protein ClpS